ncbi:unnamed protein product [Cyclocybe aegerita]|uniref:Uncharacterized protein n=1 Tax=Cyclocybe aegerita TaxID=1973307 RepID=A0A8S0VRJ1_CYCAE|nr:unnamed protein product [Cyclocybe aegerita]
MKPSTEPLKMDVRETVHEINTIVYSLHRFLSNHTQIVEKILAQKSIEVALWRRKELHVLDVADEMDDEHVELISQYGGETEGERVYRYLQTVVAWDAAIDMLLHPKYQALLAGVSFGLVEVTGRETRLMKVDEFATEYFARGSTATSNDEVEIRDILASATPIRFGGTIHAEATLIFSPTFFTQTPPAIVLATWTLMD